MPKRRTKKKLSSLPKLPDYVPYESTPGYRIREQKLYQMMQKIIRDKPEVFGTNHIGITKILFANNIIILHDRYSNEYGFSHYNEDGDKNKITEDELARINMNIGRKTSNYDYLIGKLKSLAMMESKSENKPFSYKKEDMKHDIEKAILTMSFDSLPFRNYLEQFREAIYKNKGVYRFLRRKHKTNQWRLEGLFDELFNLSDEYQSSEEMKELLRFASRFTILALVHRNLNPGCEVHIHITLASPGDEENTGQDGHGKSTFAKNILPKESDIHNDLFTDQLDLTASQDTIGQNLSQYILFELSEGGGAKRTTQERYKMLTTLNKVDDRRFYEDRRKGRLARHVFIRTTNDEKPVNSDMSGNRRTIPMMIFGLPKRTRRYIEEYMNRYRDELFLEAVYMYLFPDEFKIYIEAGDKVFKALQQLNQKYTYVPEHELTIEKKILNQIAKDFPSKKYKKTAKELLETPEYFGIGINSPKSLGKYLSNIKTKYKIIDYEVGYKKTKYWYRTDNWNHWQGNYEWYNH